MTVHKLFPVDVGCRKKRRPRIKDARYPLTELDFPKSKPFVHNGSLNQPKSRGLCDKTQARMQFGQMYYIQFEY